MYLHVVNTWFIANLLHPVILFFYFEGAENFEPEMIGFGLQFLVLSFLFSLPSLLLGMGIIYTLFKLSFSVTGRYILWLIVTLLIVIINFWIIFYGFSGAHINKNDFEIIIPALIATGITVITRHAPFFQLTAQLKSKENEDSLV